MFQAPVLWRGIIYAILMSFGKLSCGLWLLRLSTPEKNESDAGKGKLKSRQLPRPKSVYPASILGCAMVARGEIGFLISALAATNGIFNAEGEASEKAAVESELYLIVIWAILLCTVAGPMTLGFLVRRVRLLQQQKPCTDGAKEHPLGVWALS